MCVLTYGCIVKNLFVSNGAGDVFDTVLGYDSLENYEEDEFYMGAVIGRVANRIENASFNLNGRTYLLSRNSGKHHLHGGERGFSKRVWQVNYKSRNSLFLHRRSEHMEEGYPGALETDVCYEVTDDNELIISYEAVADKDTLLALTNHSYFNLDNSSDILKHKLRIFSDKVLLSSPEVIPLKIARVENLSEFDFRKEKYINELFSLGSDELGKTRGYDNSFIFADESMKKMAELSSPLSGIKMAVSGNTDVVHLYSGNFLHTSYGKNKTFYGPQSGICFETGSYPNAAVRTDFPPIVLKAGEIYKKESRFEFSANEY